MDQPLTLAQDHDRRIGRLEGIAEQLTEQGRQIAVRLDRLEARMDALAQRMDAQTRWLVGLHLASLLALGSLMVTILLRLP